MDDLSWPLIVGLAATGIPLALVSCLVGMRPKLENPAWWVLYLIWIAVVLYLGASPFWTILIASFIAGVFHALTTGLLLDQYRKNNPWHAEGMSDSNAREARRFLLIGLIAGLSMGAVFGGLAWGIHRLIN